MAFENLLVEYGLVQFGRFADANGDFVPFKLHLDWISSYPDVLKAAAFEVQKHFEVPNTIRQSTSLSAFSAR